MNTESILNLRKFLAPEIVYGDGAIALSGRHADNLGASKVFIVTDPGVRRAGWTSSVEESLKQAEIPFTIFDEVTENPKDYEVMNGARICKKESCDLIIAVGGGSPMDCAKGIGVVMGNPGHILEFQGVDMIPNPGPPLIFIPTTAGTSADVSQFAIITDTARKIKITIISKMVIPDIALIDPKTTTTMSDELTAATGMDALCHAFEAFVSTASSPLTDMAAIAAVEIIADNLLKAYQEPGNMIYRDKMMTASLMAGLAFSNASLGMVHAMAHSLGGGLGLPHGECNALLLEKVVLFNYSAASGKYDQLAKAMHLDINRHTIEEKGYVISEQIATLRKKLNINQKLIDLGVKSSDIPELCKFAFMDPCLATNPQEATPEDIEKVYLQIYK
ncbi:MAG: iron-containing alcohol dehydrogenase [Proteobacteria bacterium]|nr:iron-containing alcohol dehydrogenase [Desulfobacula sp.]MBU3951626.1 iron-containing alcohol dehydrogenase [Pseudomonadota bacterium]MBU4132778.1 iron-containing alcohol dehydrogenase [Pseudomonadota bacterium]